MILAVDDVIPYWREAFAPLGDVRSFSARRLRAEDLRDVDALVVRSVTRVGPELLEGTRVRFVGTASVGMDNLDEAYLTARGIPYSNAAGCNSNAVAEYVTAALLVVARRRGWELPGKQLGIIGAGHVGSAVEAKARALGIGVILCDPPLADATGSRRYRPFDEVLAADVLTLHVPLARAGPYPTWHMFGHSVFERLTERQFLVNASRGAVVDGAALEAALASQRIAGAVLDVWEGEPRIRFELLDRVDLGTSHIAGYSFDGKVRCTQMIVEALSRHFGLGTAWSTEHLFPPPKQLEVPPGASGREAVETAVSAAYDIVRDDANLRALRDLPPEPAAAGFDRLRNEYPLRPEFRHYSVSVDPRSVDLAATLTGLGFRVAAG